MPKHYGLVKKAKRIYRQVKEGPKYHEEEQKRKTASTKKVVKKSKYKQQGRLGVTAKRRTKGKKDWTDEYNASTRKIIKQLRGSGVSDDDIKSLLDK